MGVPHVLPLTRARHERRRAMIRLARRCFEVGSKEAAMTRRSGFASHCFVGLHGLRPDALRPLRLASGAPALEASSVSPALAGTAADATAADTAAWAWNSVGMVQVEDEADTLQSTLAARFGVGRRDSSSTTVWPPSSTDAAHDTESRKELDQRFAHRHRAGSLCPLT